jgi:hypothetical protein
MFPKVGLLGKTKGGRKEKRTIVSNNEIHNISVGTKHKESR